LVKILVPGAPRRSRLRDQDFQHVDKKYWKYWSWRLPADQYFNIWLTIYWSRELPARSRLGDKYVQ
jgi:hypothetical protein